MEPIVTEETVYRTVETSKSAVQTSKTILSKTNTTNAVQVNYYDGQGNLKSTESDSQSWEETDTQHYHKDGPSDPLDDVGLDERQILRSSSSKEQTAVEDGKTMILTSSEVHAGPVVRWSDTEVDAQADENSQHKLAVKSDGCSWSRSEESVSVSTTGKISPFIPSNLKAIKQLNPSPSPPVDIQQAVQCNSASNTKPISNGVSEHMDKLDVSERRKRRCNENAARRQANQVVH